MQPYTLLILPAIASMVWALYTKYQQRKHTDLLILSLAAVGVLVNAHLVYWMILGNFPEDWHMVQMLACTCLIPLIYTYFARQVGRQTTNSTAVTLLWLLAAFSFLPEVIIYNPFKPFQMPETGLYPFVFYVISPEGEKLLAMYTSDIVTILQSLIAGLRIIPFMITMRQHNLKFNRNLYAFLPCWAVTIVFIIMLSSMSFEDLRSTAGSWFYFGAYSMILININVLIAKRYDLYPLETEEGEAIEDLGVYVKERHIQLVECLRGLMEKDELYLNPMLSAENVVERLGTNHTYFAQMMMAEWGMSFSEYLNELRLRRVEKLLLDPSITVSSAAQQSGFADGSYMSRKFKAKHGVPPKEWRTMHAVE